jgi:hypothetical protein
MFLRFLVNRSDELLVVGLFGLLVWFVVWLGRRGTIILREGTYYRTYIRGVFDWNRVYRYGMPVYIAGGTSIGGAVLIVVMAVAKAAAYPLEMPYLWKIPFEALWQGLPVPVLGYMLAEWVHARQRHRKRKRPPPRTHPDDAELLARVQRLNQRDDDTTTPDRPKSPSQKTL